MQRKSTMKHRIRGFLVGVAGLASAALFALSGASCSPPTIQCVVAHAQFGSYFVTYAHTGGDMGCYGVKGEDIAMSTYLQPTADGSFADFSNRSIAIQSRTMGEIFLSRQGAGTDENDHPYALGKYTTAPDDNNLCYAGGAAGTPTLDVADLDIAAFDELDDMGMVINTLPAQHYKQEWKNVKIYVTAGVTGTQAVGEMHFEDVTGGCTEDFKFVALYPSHACEMGVDVDDDGVPGNDDNDDADPDNPDDPMIVPDPGACNPKADPDNGRPFGSGINPDFKVKCDVDLLHCVLDEAPLPGAP